jgi:hypothetical protein
MQSSIGKIIRLSGAKGDDTWIPDFTPGRARYPSGLVVGLEQLGPRDARSKACWKTGDMVVCFRDAGTVLHFYVLRPWRQDGNDRFILIDRCGLRYKGIGSMMLTSYERDTKRVELSELTQKEVFQEVQIV